MRRPWHCPLHLVVVTRPRTVRTVYSLCLYILTPSSKRGTPVIDAVFFLRTSSVQVKRPNCARGYSTHDGLCSLRADAALSWLERAHVPVTASLFLRMKSRVVVFTEGGRSTRSFRSIYHMRTYKGILCTYYVVTVVLYL